MAQFMKGDWVIYWHKPTAMQTLYSGWTGPYVVIEKVSVVDNRIQLNPTGPSKVEHVDQLILDPCHQDRANSVRDELALQINEWVIDVGTDTIISQQTTVGVSIACQTSDKDPIVVSNNKVALTIIVRWSSRRKLKKIDKMVSSVTSCRMKKNARLEDTE